MPHMMIVLSGSSHPDFVRLICEDLSIRESQVNSTKFANGETGLDINVSVRDQDVFIVQTGCSPVNDIMMELMIMIHACKISAAKRVTVVLPYLPYSKQTSLSDHSANDATSPTLGPRRRSMPRMSAFDGLDNLSLSSPSEYIPWPIQTNTLIANMLTTAGADHIITMDLHDPQFQGFFDIPLENLQSLPLMAKCIKQIMVSHNELIIVSPDAGGAKRTSQLAEAMGIDFALVHQDRRTGSVTDTNILIGSVEGKTAILMDDIADTCETLVKAAELLYQKGAVKILAIVTHGIFSGDSLSLLDRSHIDTIYISNTIPQTRALSLGPKFQLFDVSCMFSEAIRRLHNGEPFTSLYKPDAFH